MNKPKILILDIEATDLAADIGNLLSIGYKWLGEKKAHIMSIADYPGKKLNDDSRLIEAFRPILEEADLVIHHFGDFYDYPFLRTRALIHNLSPLAEVKTVDTWKIAKKKLKFGSNRLERILEVLGCPYKKTPVQLSIWADARVGDRKALKYIIDHNYWDVMVEEWVYVRMAPVWSQHPTMVIDKNKVNCPHCGNEKSRSLGRDYCQTKIYQRRQCLSCGKTYRAKEIA